MQAKRIQVYKVLLIALALLTIIILWLTNEVKPDNFILNVRTIAAWGFMETPFLYAFLMLFTLSFPLLRSFEPRLDYFHKWKFLVPGILIVGAVFVVWDAYFTRIGVWGFNDSYLTGFRLLYLPWEEWTFFVFVPFACVFIYEAILYFVKKDWLAPVERFITACLGGLFLLTGLIKWESIYTSTTFLLTGFFLLYHFFFIKNQPRGRFYLAYLLCLIPFLLVNGALTGGFTREPVVFYNPEEYFGLRIVSIPVDDAVYGFLLIMGNLTFYEYFKQKACIITSPATIRR